jgi:16S rRNA (cytidine1402-2'-O)-methyltransferase
MDKTIEKSVNSDIGQLIMAATSIGDPADIPVRSLVALRESDLVLFEDARMGRQFLKAAGIHRDFLVWSEHAESTALEALASTLKKGGRVVYMSDQGSPTLEDPGMGVLQAAWSLGAKVTVIPGPSSITAALSACPFPVRRFIHAGMLDRDPEQRASELQNLASMGLPLILMDVPYRLKGLLETCISVLGESHEGFLALDISGPRESWQRGSLAKLLQIASALDEKLNFVLVMKGSMKTVRQPSNPLSVPRPDHRGDGRRNESRSKRR